MSCSYCGTQQCQGGCMARQSLNQAANQISAQGMNYRAMQQAQINAGIFPTYNPSEDDQDYKMFKKYAHLTEQEMMEKFLGEQKELERQAKEGADMLIQKAKDRNQAAKEEFWTWMKKYRRHFTEERFNSYFKMFL